MKLTLENRAKLACLYAGLVWGLFWIPIRMLEDAGIHGLWITVIYFLVPTICLVPLGVWRFRYIKVGGFRLQITAMLAGAALLFYTMSIVYTEVVHALLLFYLTPLWRRISADKWVHESQVAAKGTKDLFKLIIHKKVTFRGLLAWFVSTPLAMLIGSYIVFAQKLDKVWGRTSVRGITGGT